MDIIRRRKMTDETVDVAEETKVTEEPKKKHKKSKKHEGSKKHKAKKEAKKSTKKDKPVKKEKSIKKDKAKSGKDNVYRDGTVKGILFEVLKDSIGKTIEEMRSDKRVSDIVKTMQDNGKSVSQITNTLNVYFSELFTNNPIFFGKTFGKYGVNTKGTVFKIREANLNSCVFKCRSGKLTTKYAKRFGKE